MAVTTSCTTCNRDPKTVNNDNRECAHAECPHRRRCWSDGTAHSFEPFSDDPQQLDIYFDKDDE